MCYSARVWQSPPKVELDQEIRTIINIFMERKNKYVSGCLFGLLLLPLLIYVFLLIYTYRVEKHTFYIEEGGIFVQTDRNSEGDSAFVYFGKCRKDVEEKLDYYVTRRNNGRFFMTEFAIKKNSDSIFIISESPLDIRVCKSTQFHLMPHTQKMEEVKCYHPSKDTVTVSSVLLYNNWRQRFKEHPKDYSLFHFYWCTYWHQDNSLCMCKDFPTEEKSNDIILISPL